MTAEQLEGGLENMEPTLTGVVTITDRQNGKGTILTDDGKEYWFIFTMCKDGADGFNNLENGMRVTFKKTTHTLKGEIATQLVAHDVEEDTSEEVTTLVPETEKAVTEILK